MMLSPCLQHCPSKAPKHMFEDHISQLPDEVLVTILSLLPLREAASTSFLSRRWRYLWTYVENLDLYECSLNLKCPQVELQRFIKLEDPSRTRRYINWLNNVVKSHQGSSITHFKAVIYHHIGKSQVYEWISFAIMKRTQVLQLDYRHEWPPYDTDFSDHLYRCVHSDPDGTSWIKRLKTLKLSCAFVTGEILEFLLSHCPELVIMEVKYSIGLINLSVDHDQLQHLRILRCKKLKSIKIISAQNLVSFAYRGSDIGLHVDNAPSLVSLDLGSFGQDSPKFAFVSLAKFLPQLEWLAIRIAHVYYGLNLRFPHGDLTKLKNLTFEVGVWSNESLLKFTHLIEKSPFLEKFTLKFYGHDTFYGRTCNLDQLTKKIPNLPHYHLKQVEFVGFAGDRGDTELAQYVLQNAINLEKFVIDLACPVARGGRSKFKLRLAAYKLAKELILMRPSKVDFRIINLREGLGVTND